MTFTIHLPVDLARALQLRAADEGVPVETFVEHALRALVSPGGGVGSVAPQGTGDEEGTAVWRGTWVVEPLREALFTEEVRLPPAGLPRWQPEVPLDLRPGSDADE